MRIFSHPIKKLTILGIFAGGYVLGSRAGRERYEQIVEAANRVKADPRVDDVITRAEDVLHDAGGTAGNSDDSTPTSTVSPAPADEHIEPEDKVVYSAGPDIEETVDDLRAHDERERI